MLWCNRVLKASPVPVRTVRRRFVGTLQKLHQDSIGICRPAHLFIGQHELAQRRIEKCLGRGYPVRGVAGRLRIGIAIK